MLRIGGLFPRSGLDESHFVIGSAVTTSNLPSCLENHMDSWRKLKFLRLLFETFYREAQRMKGNRSDGLGRTERARHRQ